ncbi:MAG: repressor LexA [Bacteroidetes bacterium HGW-Bacteroidetes-3]|jgi:repressor LexA|nr:MAG: repressor LexA [Bacteroidetes bacterium HGW-Bacteroidetes-3]
MFLELTNKELQGLKVIRNYLFLHGEMPSVRELMRGLKYKSPRSASLMYQNLEQKGVLRKKLDGSFQLSEFEISESFGTREQTIKVPLLGSIACGLPIFAEENVEAEIPVSIKFIKSDYKYFLLKAVGDSMNLAGINEGDLVLIRQQQHAENGDRVVALIDDEATIKEYRNNGDHIVLLPKSTTKEHQPIVLTRDFKIQGIVERVISIN